MDKEEKEDLLKYFNEWNGITPGAYEGLAEGKQRSVVQPPQYPPADGYGRTFPIPVHDLWTTLSRLEYIGKHKENIVVAERSRQPKESSESRWNILD